MISPLRRLRNLPIGLLIGGLLLAVFATAALVPIPTAGNQPLEEVLEEVESRLPGWTVVRANESWENNYTVVAVCAKRELGFQLVPARRMAPGDAFVVPDDRFSRSRLRVVADDRYHLFWRAGTAVDRPLVCQERLAAGDSAVPTEQ